MVLEVGSGHRVEKMESAQEQGARGWSGRGGRACGSKGDILEVPGLRHGCCAALAQHCGSGRVELCNTHIRLQDRGNLPISVKRVFLYF